MSHVQCPIGWFWIRSVLCFWFWLVENVHASYLGITRRDLCPIPGIEFDDFYLNFDWAIRSSYIYGKRAVWLDVDNVNPISTSLRFTLFVVISHAHPRDDSSILCPYGHTYRTRSTTRNSALPTMHPVFSKTWERLLVWIPRRIKRALSGPWVRLRRKASPACSSTLRAIASTL